jgi:Flp pilus assembly pilin Flp
MLSPAARRLTSPNRRKEGSYMLERLRDESGQTMAEYAVVLGVITIGVVVVLTALSTAIKSTLTNVIASM